MQLEPKAGGVRPPPPWPAVTWQQQTVSSLFPNFEAAGIEKL
jgi:hypothetical protein